LSCVCTTSAHSSPRLSPSSNIYAPPAGQRWHIDCFRCSTCSTLLDSDAHLLLLGDGSLICSNCTYSCNSCGNKIEDLAILTGDQAFCAQCFRCRNCKRKIENLRYARTSQGIFCMDCHESLMQRRRKKKANAAAKKPGGPGTKYDKSLPSLPPSMEETRSIDETPTEAFAEIAVDNRPDTAASEPAAAGKETTMRVNLFFLILSYACLRFRFRFPFRFHPPKEITTNNDPSSVQTTISFSLPAHIVAVVRSVRNGIPPPMPILQTQVASS
jgi:hypothetical protein